MKHPQCQTLLGHGTCIAISTAQSVSLLGILDSGSMGDRGQSKHATATCSSTIYILADYSRLAAYTLLKLYLVFPVRSLTCSTSTLGSGGLLEGLHARKWLWSSSAAGVAEKKHSGELMGIRLQDSQQLSAVCMTSDCATISVGGAGPVVPPSPASTAGLTLGCSMERLLPPQTLHLL
jgi:hypothetical protein